MSHARSYYYEKATKEIKEFTKKKKYENISTEKYSVLYYTDRILPERKVNSVATLSGVIKDLSASNFVVPVVDKHSPLAYSIVSEVHWYDKVAKHAGIETVLRFTLKYAFILEGREIVKKIKSRCERCTYIYKRTIDVTMGPVSQYNLMIAPAFYVSQIDIAGPFKVYSSHNKRTTIKIYHCVYCCATTRTVNIKVLEDYSTSSPPPPPPPPLPEKIPNKKPAGKNLFPFGHSGLSKFLAILVMTSLWAKRHSAYISRL